MNNELRENSRNKKQNVIAIAILIVGTILSFIFFGTKNEDEIVENGTAIKEVEVLRLEKNQQSTTYLTKTVQIDSGKSAEAMSEYTGRVSRILFNVGDYVKQGQILIEFDQSSKNNSPRVSFDSAQTFYELTRKSFENTKESAQKSIDLAKNGVNVAEIQLEQAEESDNDDAIDLAEEALESAKNQKKQAEIGADIQINTAKIQLEQAEAQLQQARINLNKTLIKAPASGYVVSKNISENDYLNMGQTVAQISSDEKLQMVVYLNKTEILKVNKELPINVVFNKEIFPAKIKAMSDIANSSNQRHEVFIELETEDSRLINQNVKVEIPLKLENSDGFFIPLKAVNIGQKKNEVFIVKDGKAMAIEVELGQIIGEQVEITKGLRENDNLVIKGNKKIRDEEVVKIIE